MSASTAWLVTADESASVLTAAIGAMSFGWTVITSQGGDPLPRMRHAVERMRQLKHFNFASLLGIAALLSFVIELAAAPSLSVSIVLSVTIVTAAAAALTLFISDNIVARRSARMLLPAGIRAILEVEKRASESHRYSFGSLHIPSVSKLYVPRRGEDWNSSEAPAIQLKAANKTTIEAALGRYRHSVIIAGPGGGKSTLSAWIVGESARWWLKASRREKVSNAPYGPIVAIYMHASDLDSASLEEAIALRYHRMGVTQLTSDDLRRRPLKDADWLVFVDGVDELLEIDRRSSALNVLASYLSDSESPLRVVVASRPLPIGEIAELQFANVGQIHLRPFDRDDIREFGKNWFTARASRPMNTQQVEEQIANFSNSVGTAGLAGMMRVPLLVAMAALIYERNVNSKLPATRSDLYREYISLLLSARLGAAWRTSKPQPGAELPDPSFFSDWLAYVMHDLLLALAIARVRDSRCSLMEISRGWVRRQLSSEQIAEPEWPWVGVLHNALLATSVLEAVGPDVEFLHQSVAEYLAAEEHARHTDFRTIKAEIADPALRSLALFSLARSGLEVTALVESFLEEGDALSAARILADGFTVGAELEHRIIRGLLRLVGEDNPSAMECVGILADLAVQESVRTELIEIVEDSCEGPWLRAVIADSVSELYPELGTRLLRAVATDRRSGSDTSRMWAAQRLQARDDEFATRIRREIDGSTLLDSNIEEPIIEHAIRKAALDVRTAPEERIAAAVRLADIGDSVGVQVLRQIAEWSANVDAAERAAAARLLLERGDSSGRTVLEGIAKDRRVDESTRRMAAALLSGDESDAEASILRERAGDRGLDPWRRRAAAEALARRDDPVGLKVLRELVDDERVETLERYEAAQSLARYGDAVGVDYLLTMSQGSFGSYDVRYTAATALARSDRGRSRVDALARLASDLTGDPWERRMAAQLLFTMTRSETSIDALTSIAMDAATSADERYEAAMVLFDGDVAVGARVLEKISHEVGNSFRVRYKSALALLEKGRKPGFDVMRQLAQDESSMSDDRRLAARVLAEYRDEIGLETLRKLASNGSEKVDDRRQAALALAKLGDAVGLQVLQMLEDSTTW